jgi:hypothetical protein
MDINKIFVGDDARTVVYSACLGGCKNLKDDQE